MTTYWGPLYWNFLHSVIEKYPEEPQPIHTQIYGKLVLLFVDLLPCSSCRKHFIKILRKYPIKMKNKIELRKWGVDIHNEVNQRLKKPIFKDTIQIEANQLHQQIYKFVKYVQYQVKVNQLAYSHLVSLMTLLIVVHPCELCRSTYVKRFHADKLPSLMLSRISFEKWLNSFWKPNGQHSDHLAKKMNKKKKHKKHSNTINVSNVRNVSNVNKTIKLTTNSIAVNTS